MLHFYNLIINKLMISLATDIFLKRLNKKWFSTVQINFQKANKSVKISLSNEKKRNPLSH
jgi:hypothetical protein